METQSQFNLSQSNNVEYPIVKKLIETRHVTDYKIESEEENDSEIEKQDLSSNQVDFSDLFDYDKSNKDDDSEQDNMVSIEKIKELLNKKTKDQFKLIYGRDGNEKEISQLNKETLKKFLSWNQKQLEKEEFDGTYDPKDDESIQDKDEEDDENDEEDDVETDDESTQAMNTLKDDEFESYRETEEYDQAIAIAKSCAENDREKIIQSFGQDVPIQLLKDGFSALKVTLGLGEDDQDDEEQDEEEETEEIEQLEDGDEKVKEEDESDAEVDDNYSDESDVEILLSDEELQQELSEAFDHIRELGKSQQPELVDKICETFIEINGEEPSSEEVIDIFKRIKETFMEEAEDEVLDDVVENIEDSEDSEEDESKDDKDKTEKSDKSSDYTVSNELTSSQKRVALIVGAKTSSDLIDYSRYAIDEDIEESAKEEFSILSGRSPTKEETTLLLVQLSTTSFLEASFSDGESDYDSSYDPSDENEKNQISKDEQDSDDYYQTDDGESDEYEVDKSDSDDDESDQSDE